MHHHPVFARFYDRLSRGAEDHGLGELRDRLLAGLSGRVLEVGAGNGLNLRHIPAAVAEVVAVEPEPYLRARASEIAAATGVETRVIGATAGRLPLDDASFDAGVTSLVLCSVPRQEEALAELFRVIRPGGELRFLEHVAATTSGLRWTQRALDATVWPWFGGGCHTARDTTTAITDAGFELVEVDRFRFPESPTSPVSPHVLGVARRP